MSEPFLGMIAIYGFNFAPRGWAMCNGQILPIAQNTALFSLLGTTYGGNGQTTFALPNLQSRWPLHFGQGPGLSSYDLGQAAGTETVTLTVNQIPAHQHPVNATENDASSSKPATASCSLGWIICQYARRTCTDVGEHDSSLAGEATSRIRIYSHTSRSTSA